MNKYAILPNWLLKEERRYRYGHFRCLFDMIRVRLGFKLCFASYDGMDVPSDADIVLAYSWDVDGATINSMNRLSQWKMSGGKGLICWFGDIPRAGRGIYAEPFDALLKASDAIIGTWNSYFKKRWPQYVSKHIFFPSFVAPYERFANLQFNNDPIKKCLLIGQVKVTYPIRTYVRNAVALHEALRPFIDIQRHPRFPKQFGTLEGFAKNDGYAKRINEYLCCVTDGGIHGLVVAKHLELPATGSLLLAEKTPDLTTAGFIPNVHYIPVTKSNVIEVIKQVVMAPESVTEIRKSGRAFVLENHGANNRVLQLKEILGRL